ncbi:hypothetical protein HV438_18755 [Bacillus sporothermodurans]|uniref:hypothetical protein n=1 Tax=Heyndrickxia sporothermodurans TaxID=46224 RepID=UPI00192CA9DE|nr:hypothetical protein [Heyndrickxia sporothermodurans]MBL5780183.1 hypothetical protein [Heyndrickxia sporothermodurans]
MKKSLKIWFIGVILFGLLVGTSQSDSFAASSKKVLSTEFKNGLVSFMQNGKYGMLDPLC